MKIESCYNCGYYFEAKYKPGFRDECPECTSDVHVCRNCEFYDTSYNNECRETQADRVVDKEKNNFCEYFSFQDKDNAVVSNPNPHVNDARKKFDDLFNN